MWDGNALTTNVPYTLDFDVEAIADLQLLFPSGETEQKFNVTIQDDDFPELQERFAVFISQVNEIEYQPRTIVLVVIEDDDLTGMCVFVRLFVCLFCLCLAIDIVINNYYAYLTTVA